MGLGSSFRRAVSRLDDKARAVIAKPLDKSSIKTVAPIALGPTSTAIKFGRDSGFFNDVKNIVNDTIKSGFKKNIQDQKNLVAKIRQDPAIKQGIRDLKGPQDKRKRQQAAVIAGYAVIVVAVVVICVYSFGSGCAPAVSVGLAAATTLAGVDAKYKAEVKFRDEQARLAAENARIAEQYAYDGQTTEQGSYGDAGGSLFDGDFSGVGESFDLNTLAGKKTWLVIGGASIAAIGLYYGIRYLRK